MVNLCLSELSSSPECDCGTCQAIASVRRFGEDTDHLHRCEAEVDHIEAHQCRCGEVW